MGDLVLEVCLPFLVCFVALYDYLELLQKVDFILAEHKGRVETSLKLKEILTVFEEQRVTERPHQLLENTRMLGEKFIDILS